MEKILSTTLSIATATVDQLEAIGGRPWRDQSGSIRVYFNNLPELFGLDLSFYKTGNVCSAKLDGQTISNSQASRYLATFESMKVWVAGGALTCRARLRPLVDCDYAAVFADALVTKLQTQQVAAERTGRVARSEFCWSTNRTAMPTLDGRACAQRWKARSRDHDDAVRRDAGRSNALNAIEVGAPSQGRALVDSSLGEGQNSPQPRP